MAKAFDYFSCDGRQEYDEETETVYIPDEDEFLGRNEDQPDEEE